MEIRFTDHAQQRMTDEEITDADVEAILVDPERVTRGETATEYDGVVGGRPIHLVVVSDSDPPVITVCEIIREELRCTCSTIPTPTQFT